MNITKHTTRWASIAGATAIVATSLFLAPGAASAASADDGATTTECHLGQRLVAVWNKAPQELQDDIKALRDLPPEERRDAARDIREGARDGEYGEGVQNYAQRIRDRRLWIWGTMNDDLKAELKDIAAADPADRPALVDELAANALAGTYGDRAQTVAEHLQEHCG